MLEATLNYVRKVRVIVEPGAIARLSELVNDMEPYKIAVLADGGLPWFWVDAVAEALGDAGRGVKVVSLPTGEKCKDIEVAIRVWERLLAADFTRDSLVVGLGGGSALDLAGFVASTFMRGCYLIYVPSTLLAQVDAAIGGKTGVNVGGKNIVGTFYHPDYVVIDPKILMTLPEEEFRAGFSEVVKHAAISGDEAVRTLERLAGRALLKNIDALTHIIRDSVSTKLSIVTRDFTEKGLRMILNFGHTVAHALERALKFEIKHGHAVSIGIVIESRIAETLLGFPECESKRICNLLTLFGLPTTPPISLKEVTHHVRFDKKRRQGRVVLPLPRNLGKFELVNLDLGEFKRCLLMLET